MIEVLLIHKDVGTYFCEQAPLDEFWYNVFSYLPHSKANYRLLLYMNHFKKMEPHELNLDDILNVGIGMGIYLLEYAMNFGMLPEGYEKILIESSDNPYWLLLYAMFVKKGRWKEAEEKLMEDYSSTALYIVHLNQSLRDDYENRIKEKLDEYKNFEATE